MARATRPRSRRRGACSRRWPRRGAAGRSPRRSGAARGATTWPPMPRSPTASTAAGRYLRGGMVIDLQVLPGAVTALVSGSDVYEIAVRIKAMPEPRWKAVVKACAGKIDSVVELLAGRFDESVMAHVCRQGTGLFPAPAEITYECSCPDGARGGWLCKHVAATLYGVGVRLDEDPRAPVPAAPRRPRRPHRPRHRRPDAATGSVEAQRPPRDRLRPPVRGLRHRARGRPGPPRAPPGPQAEVPVALPLGVLISERPPIAPALCRAPFSPQVASPSGR